MVIWVCEASEVNNLTVLAVGPNHRDKDNKILRGLYNKIASSRSDPPKGSDKHLRYWQKCSKSQKVPSAEGYTVQGDQERL